MHFVRPSFHQFSPTLILISPHQKKNCGGKTFFRYEVGTPMKKFSNILNAVRYTIISPVFTNPNFNFTTPKKNCGGKKFVHYEVGTPMKKFLNILIALRFTCFLQPQFLFHHTKKKAVVKNFFYY